MLNVIFLTEKFYRRYKDCPEIEQKTSRPYIRVGVLIDGVLWAIPMRSNINHEHTIWTDKANKCGIRLSALSSKAQDIVSPSNSD